MLPGFISGSVLAACVLLSISSARAQEATPPPLQAAETPPPRVVRATPAPEPVAEATPPPKAAKPTPRVRAPKATPTPGPDEPAAVVNGKPVYRPLFRSVVADPVDRALILTEYHRRGLVVPDVALNEAVRNFTKTAFGDQNGLIEKLHEQGATFDDYRAFVAEEVKLNAMLNIVSKGGRTDADRKTLRDTWLAEQRKKASINKPGKT